MANKPQNKTHCTNGHEYTPENKYIHKNGTYSCRRCRREHTARDRYNNKPPEQYKNKTEIALEIARADYNMGFYNLNGYATDTYWSVMHALNELEV